MTGPYGQLASSIISVPLCHTSCLLKIAHILKNTSLLFAGELKRSLDIRQSPPLELPSKMLKYKRMKERQQQLAAQAENDSSTKCAGTQT